MAGDLSATEGISAQDQSWPWWPLLPLYPYGRRRTLMRELFPGQLWSFEQLQGLYYVAVPVRLTVVKVNGGLMLVNPLPPTAELCRGIRDLERQHGPVVSIVLPTASGLEHKLPLPPLARAFPEADLWLCPGQWTFPLQIPSSWLGIPSARTRLLFEDGLPHQECCRWLSLGPIDLGLGPFQEVACLHAPTGALLVTDALVGIEATPPQLFELDPTPLLFHARERGDQPLQDSPEARRRGWARLVLFASFLKPDAVEIPSLLTVLRYSFRPGLRSIRSHFGLYPFAWKQDWQLAAQALIGDQSPRLQIAPVIERLVMPRAKDLFLRWLDGLLAFQELSWLVPAHYSAPIPFTASEVRAMRLSITSRGWASNYGDWTFLGSFDSALLKLGVVPKDPLESFRD